MIRATSHSALWLLCLLPWLAGCAAFTSDSIPPESKALGITAQNMALEQAVREGHGGQPDVFVPLVKAEAAVEAARVQPKVETYAADALAQARAELSKAQQLWSARSGEDGRDVARLARIQSHAHDAQRLAQIARYTALREINLTQLRDTSAQLQRSGTSGTKVAGTKVVPGKLGAFAFRPGTARLVADSRLVVDNLAALLKSRPDTGVVLLGYTDNAEPSKQAMQRFTQANSQLQQRNLSHEQLVYAYHLALSSARVRVVARALVQAGVAPRRVGAKGYGSQRPVASNETAKGRAANRRVVAILVAGPDDKSSPLYRPSN